MTAPTPPPAGPSRESERGAAVILFVALVVAAAIAAAAAMLVGRPQFAVQQNTGTGFDLTALRKAVEAHAMVVNGGTVVCPDTNGDGTENTPCASPSNGLLAWRTIGVAPAQVNDAWGQPVRIVRSTSQDRRLSSFRGGENEGPCDFILVSGGDDLTIDASLTATPVDVRDAGAGRDRDLAVCGKLGDGGYTPPSMMNRNLIITEDSAQHIAPRDKDPPRQDWAESDQVMYFGGSSDDAATYDLTAANVSKTACAWVEDNFPFTTQVLRGYLRFQFLPGEASVTQTLGTSQGFALMVIPGSRMVDADPTDATKPTAQCGLAASDNAYGFKGVPRPKFAVEFDIYRDNYEGMNDHSGGRDNPKPEGNHVAVLNPLTQDYISHGGYGNPSCQDWGTYGTGPAMDGDEGACTYPPGDANQYTPSGADPRPARHATRPANWLEDKQFTDTALGQLAAQPYQARFEFKRRCNADCSVCGVENAANTYFQLKVWVACDEVLEGNPNACPHFPEEFQRLDGLYEDTTDYMINTCEPDRSYNADGSLRYGESLDEVKVGIGFSTRNSAVALMLHRFEVLSEDPP